LIVVCLVAVYYIVRYVRVRPKKTGPGRVGIWLAQLEGDSRGGYLRDLKGQVERELSPDPSLRDVEVSVYPRALDSHEEAREVGSKLNARGVVWGNLGRGLNGGRVSNLKLTVIGGPMNLQNDVQFRSEVDLGGYEMRDVARFVAGYALLSGGKPAEAVVHFDGILEDPRPGLFELADALQFGGIASFLSTQGSADSCELLEKAKGYFTKYRDLWPEDRDPLPRAMGFFNLGSVEYRLRGDSPEGINETLRLYDEAAKLFDKAGDDEGYAMVQLEVVHVLSDLYQIHNEPAYCTGAHIRLEEAARFIKKEKDPTEDRKGGTATKRQLRWWRGSTRGPTSIPSGHSTPRVRTSGC
jgi:tetratricopeptide (TPR) repeat protein